MSDWPMRWMLMATICTGTAQLDCERIEQAVFGSYAVCFTAGLTMDPSAEFQCVPEFRNGVPLPRPRPAAVVPLPRPRPQP